MFPIKWRYCQPAVSVFGKGVERQQSRCTQWSRCLQQKSHQLMRNYNVGQSFLPERSSSLRLPVTCDGISSWMNHLSGKGKARGSEGMAPGWPLGMNKRFKIIQTWSRKSPWRFLRDLWFKKKKKRERTFETVIFNNSIRMDYGLALILKLLLKKSSCRNKSNYFSNRNGC